MLMKEARVRATKDEALLEIRMSEKRSCLWALGTGVMVRKLAEGEK